MKALVVYESMFGNTEQVARAVAAGLREVLEVTVREVSDTPIGAVQDVDLVVAGGPTHASR
ncbi:MAG: flavodoxin domain-containing protein [Microlunatus sp.]|nr:flavodoxin domain-containing protein [Microlunatus sp.]MDN5769830.1 flavodoxin domain-containing protein [Microlunatus sp.]